MEVINKIWNWLHENWKELIFFLFTWVIGWYLFGIVICKIDLNCKDCITTEHWTIFYTAIFLLLLPFVSKITLGSILKVERELKETKKELKDHREFTQNQFQFLTNNLNFLSQNLSNNINIYNNAPDAETLEDANETLEKPDPDNKKQELVNELNLESSQDEWVWIFNLLKIRVQMEKELRNLLEKRTSVENRKDLNIKYFSLNRLFDFYIEKYPDSKSLKTPMRLFSSVANAAIHGQTISRNQYEEAKELGIKILRDIRITTVLDD